MFFFILIFLLSFLMMYIYKGLTSLQKKTDMFGFGSASSLVRSSAEASSVNALRFYCKCFDCL